MIALSIVAPNGSKIADGAKRIEVRSWRPTPPLPIRDLLIVENRHYLSPSDPVDPDGIPVAIVDIVGVHPWRKDEVAAACSAKWKPGCFAWTIENVRPLMSGTLVPAQLGLYDVPQGISLEVFGAE